jgi:hypothetical protein
MSRVLICGSRRWPGPEAITAARDLLWKLVGELPEGTVVIEGGAEGIDRWAGEMATRSGLFVARVELGPQHYRHHGKGAPFLRNHAMLDLLAAPSLLAGSEDRVIAVQHAGSTGTQHTIEEARRRGIPVEVHAL